LDRPNEDAAMTTSGRDPHHHSQKMQKALKEIQDHLREDVTKVAHSDDRDHSFRSIATSVRAPSGAFSDLSVCARRQAGRP
jgi:uncharacterized protein YciI